MERQTEPTNAQSTRYQVRGLHVRSVCGLAAEMANNAPNLIDHVAVNIQY